ncbi:hypothetical protein [Paenibacillus sp. 481]|uniref:hypothetical protein n=1 Tax=Paenibacillus sp. 481 TaxID=2835869 RepID=UPI001E48C5B2|nr:hypothetical protein [Paenibacillus sp. 481]UHA74991.1 hypothetical protein KIK04_08165 [Paenibacillus sp. 481]
MSKQRTGHVLKFEDGRYYVEEQPYYTAKLDEAKIYNKYFDLMEAQAAALRLTGSPVSMVAVSFRICDIAEVVN